MGKDLQKLAMSFEDCEIGQAYDNLISGVSENLKQLKQ
jgi:hypothetical protein